VVKEDDEVAVLYRVPLGEFTAARNALAKARGAAGGTIRTLEKPSAPAWAVNQLYWQRRNAYDEVIRTALAMREAHARQISGRGGDVPAAEAAHREAMRAATQAIRELVKAAGETASAATFEAIAETLQALPSDDLPGRLTRALKPLGFGALLALGVLKSGGPEVLGSGKSGKKEAAARAARKKSLEKQLRAAEVAARAADTALAGARKALARIERDYAATRDKQQFLEKQRADAEQDARRRARELQDAANARTQAAQDLARLS
jgi:hypothetical protein